MASKPTIAIVGPGNLGTALAFALRKAGYKIEALYSLPRGFGKARGVAKQLGARAQSSPGNLTADIFWFCVPDAKIATVARSFGKGSWQGKVALHSSGALTSDELDILRRKGAAVASVHPLMTFVRGSRPSLSGVAFAIEGDARAARGVRRIVGDLGGLTYPIRKQDKAAYHAWCTFTSPLVTALFSTAQHVAALAGVKHASAKRRMIPILRQTLINFSSHDAGSAFSGPIIRGDVETIHKHLRVLRKMPVAMGVYKALAIAALEYLPARNRKALKRALAAPGG